MMKKTTLTFYGGLRTIGGTIVSLQYGDSRVIFDFGLVYSPATNIFDGQILLRKSAIVRDYLKLGLIAKIDGIYSAKDLPKDASISGANNYEGKTAVIISHLHLDHIGAMGLIDPSIPVYMTEDSLKLYNTLDLIGEGVIGKRDYQSCRYNEAFFVGEIKITPIQVDHDILGACAYHLETPDGAIIYSGDLRMHGSHPEWIDSFIQKSKELGFDAVIMEGTTIRDEEELPEETLVPSKEIPESVTTEDMIPLKMADILKETKGLGIFNIYHRNIDRIAGIIKAAELAGRKAVFEVETAQIAYSLLDSMEFSIYESEEMRQAKLKGRLPSWQKELMEEFSVISYKEINATPEKYFVQNSYTNALELFDLDVKEGVYLHSDGVPLGDYDPAYHNLERILDHISLQRISIGTGGHAIPQNLKYIVDELDPVTLIPLHSFHPERLMPNNGVQLLPKYGESYILSDGKISKL